MELLSGSESDTDKNELKINEKYAKSYSTWRRKEEKQRLIDKYGTDQLESDSSSEEEITTTKALDKEWLRAYAVVRFNQPRLYTGEKLFNEEVKPVTKKGKKEKVTLKEHERKFITEKGGVLSEDEDDEDFRMKNAGPSYMEEQEEIKKSLKQAIGSSDDDEENDDDDGLLVKKTKTKEEQVDDENDYLAWLKGEKAGIEDKKAAEELAPLKAYWSDPNLTDKEKVLRDYILNNGYMDKEGSDDESGEDIVFDFDREEDFLDKADEYEKTYNFRHEEPGGLEIKTYPRVIESSVRAKEDNKRAEKRKRKADKQKTEKNKRLEEIKILRQLQQEEKEQKLRKLQEAAGNSHLEYNLDDDFDPEEHNKIMKKYFNDDYYEDEASAEKPIFEPDEEDDYGNDEDNWWKERGQIQMDMEEEGQGEEEMYADDPGFIMDADYDPNNTKPAKKSKKQLRLEKKKAKMEKQPLFDPTTKTFDEYLDEYLKDKINTLPFTYREVVPNDFGLSTEEILTAPDRELNAWASVKKMSMYRSQQEERQDKHKYNLKAQNTKKKLKTLPSLSEEKSDASEIKAKQKKNLGKDDNLILQVKGKSERNKKKKKKEKSEKRKHDTDAEQEEMQESGNAQSGEEPKAKKKKLIQAVDSHEERKSDDGGTLLSKNKNKSKKDKKKEKSIKDESMKDDFKSSSSKYVHTEGKPTSDEQEIKSKTVEDNTEEALEKKKKKKKKSKFQMNDDDLAEQEHKPVLKDKKKAKQNLYKVMSASRLSSYGLGPGSHNNMPGNLGKKKKKKKNVNAGGS